MELTVMMIMMMMLAVMGATHAGRRLPLQSASVRFQRTMPGGRADAAGVDEVQPRQRLHLRGGHSTQGNALQPCLDSKRRQSCALTAFLSIAECHGKSGSG